MPRVKKRFVVFSDGMIYKYIPEDDDHLIASGSGQLFDSLTPAKRYAEDCLRATLQQMIDDTRLLTYKDFP